jgi:hypothetical protein
MTSNKHVRSVRRRTRRTGHRHLHPAQASSAQAEVARLGAELTPVGAEKAGNKDGTIPAGAVA